MLNARNIDLLHSLSEKRNKNKFIVIAIIVLIIYLYRKMSFAKYFTLNEFQSKDGALMPTEVENNVRSLVKNMDVIREAVGKPIIINSGYRSPKHNQEVGGVKNSYHTKGMACDFYVKGMSTTELKNIIENLIEQGKIQKGGLGHYSTWIHYDNRGFNTRWNG